MHGWMWCARTLLWLAGLFPAGPLPEGEMGDEFVVRPVVRQAVRLEVSDVERDSPFARAGQRTAEPSPVEAVHLPTVAPTVGLRSKVTPVAGESHRRSAGDFMPIRFSPAGNRPAWQRQSLVQD